jgi:hypothetical protein
MILHQSADGTRNATRPDDAAAHPEGKATRDLAHSQHLTASEVTFRPTTPPRATIQTCIERPEPPFARALRRTSCSEDTAIGGLPGELIAHGCFSRTARRCMALVSSVDEVVFPAHAGLNRARRSCAASAPGMVSSCPYSTTAAARSGLTVGERGGAPAVPGDLMQSAYGNAMP